MILLEDILILHHLSIEDFGGSHGIHDLHLLQSATARPCQTFDGTELYKTPYEKAAALGESLIVNHPFIDGNKRIGMLAVLAMLKNYGIEINTGEDDLYNFIIDISTGKIRFDEMVDWLINKAT